MTARMRRFGRTTVVSMLAIVIAGSAGCVYLEVKERELVYRAVREDARTPANAGLAYDDVWLRVPRVEEPGDERVHAWWVPARGAGRPTILYLHGVRWSLGNNVFRIARWHELGFNVLAIDYRGFGASDGDLPSEAKVYADARAAWEEVVRREPRADQRFIYGHSLGAAVALDLAAQTDAAAGVIADSGFTTLADVVAENYPPANLLLTERFDALSRARELKMPVLFVHGTADRYVPPAMSERLYAAAPEPKRLLLIEGASHSNYGGVGLDDYRRAVQEFVGVAREAMRTRSALSSNL
jgi:pimeloyl-ACP methyl ester carboxylesterase